METVYLLSAGLGFFMLGVISLLLLLRMLRQRKRPESTPSSPPICARCGHALHRVGARFCSRCGGPLPPATV